MSSEIEGTNETEAENTSQQPIPSSQNKSNKSSSKSPIIQILLLLAVIAVFVLGLAYFNLLPTSKFLSLIPHKGLPAATPNVKPDQTGPLQMPKPDTTKKGDVIAVSDIPAYKLTTLNKSELIDLLTSWGVYGTMDYLYQAKHETSLNEITVHLTDKIQNQNIVTNPTTGTYLAAGLTLNKSSFDLYIYVLPSILLDSSKNPASLFQSEFVSTIWRFSHPTGTTTEAQKSEDDLKQIGAKLFQEKKIYFAIEKI